MILGDRRLTYGALLARAGQAAQTLSGEGVGAQDRIAFLDKNGIEHFEVFFGAGLLNAVCVDVNWRLAAPEVAYIVNDAEAKVFVVGPDFVPVLDAIADQLTSVTKIVVIGGHDKHESYDSWVTRREAIDPGTVSAAGDVAFQLYSSGTTGRPKGVMLSNDNFFALLPTAETMWEFGPDSVNLVAMPLFHIGGGGWATAGMFSGATSVLVPTRPDAARGSVAREGIAHASSCRPCSSSCSSSPCRRADFSSLRHGLQRLPISEQVLAKRSPRSMQVLATYGLTETTARREPPPETTMSGPHANRLRSCGVAGPGVELRIVDAKTGGCRRWRRGRSGFARRR